MQNIRPGQDPVPSVVINGCLDTAQTLLPGPRAVATLECVLWSRRRVCPCCWVAA